MTTLVSERLVLRPFRATDGPALAAYLSDPEVVAFEPYGPLDAEACEAEAVRRSQDADFLAVCLRDDGTLIGNLWLHRAEPDVHRTWELGYVFGRPWWHQGYATEACRRALAHLFTDRAAHRVVASCDPRNVASARLLVRLGLLQEAHHRAAATFASDELGRPVWHDADVYAALEEEWPPTP